MSVVVAIRDKDRIVVGADKQVSAGGNKDHNATKIWYMDDLEGAILGSVGSLRGSQIIQYSKIVDKNQIKGKIDTEFVICSLVPTILLRLEDNGINCKVVDKDTNESMIVMPNDFIFAYQDSAWMIWRDLSVSEIPEYLAIGSGSDIVKGALFATKNENPFDRIATSIQAAAATTLYVDDEIDLLSTDFYEEDIDPYARVMKMDEKDKKQFKKFLKSVGILDDVIPPIIDTVEPKKEKIKEPIEEKPEKVKKERKKNDAKRKEGT